MTHSAATGTRTHASYQTVAITKDFVDTYVWWDEAKQARIELHSIQEQSGMQTSDTTSDTQYSYVKNGFLSSIDVDGAQPKVVTYVTDWQGAVRFYWEYAAIPAMEPNYCNFVFDGVHMATLTNNGDPDAGYDITIGLHKSPPDNFLKYGEEVSFADYDLSYTPVNGTEAPVASRFTVRAGDSLQTIAAAVWGDASLCN